MVTVSHCPFHIHTIFFKLITISEKIFIYFFFLAQDKQLTNVEHMYICICICLTQQKYYLYPTELLIVYILFYLNI